MKVESTYDVLSLFSGTNDAYNSMEVCEYPDFTDQLRTFSNVYTMFCHGEDIKLASNPKQFFDANPLYDGIIKDSLGKDANVFKRELFYALQSGSYLPNFPTELYFAISKAFGTCDTPNKAISLIDRNIINKYLAKGKIGCDDKVFRKILALFFGHNVSILNKVNLTATFKDWVEVAVHNGNDYDILIANKSAFDTSLTSTSDIESMHYLENIGVVLGESEVPLRSILSTYGITRDDFDLRDII